MSRRCYIPNCCNPKPSKILSIYYSTLSMQNLLFSSPDSIIYYTTKNPSSQRLFLKLIQSCKYFYHTNPMIFICCFLIDRKQKCWRSSFHECCRDKIDFNKIPAQIWLTYYLSVTKRTLAFENILHSKIYRCDVKKLWLKKFTITFEEFKFLSPSVTRICFHWVIIKYRNGNLVELETIIENLPNLTKFSYILIPEAQNLSSETVKKIVKIKHFQNLKLFWLFDIPETFDMKTFSKFLNEHRQMWCKLVFSKNLSANYQKHVRNCEKKLNRRSFDELFEIYFYSNDYEFSSSTDDD